MGKTKHIIWMIVVIACLGAVSLFLFKLTTTSEDMPVAKPETKPEEETVSSAERTKRISEIEDMLNDPYLILVNADNGLGIEDKPESTATLQSMTLESETAEHLEQMLLAAENAGLDTITIYSAYRNYSKQEQNFNNKINKYLNQGYSQEKAEQLAAAIVNPPGKSEHQTGLAADICTPEMVNRYGSLPEEFEDTDEYRWLYEHCAEYGFILRYPKDKVEITGITFEPWHYRYVGQKYAKEIMQQKVCLEEYIENLKAEKAELEKS